MSAFVGETISIDGFVTQLRVCGDGPNAMVFFPAVMDTASSFGRLQLMLRRPLGSSVATVSVDPPGYLQEGEIPDFSRWPAFCESLSEWLARRFSGSLIFAGNSSGAVAATECALASQRAAGLCLLCWCDWAHTEPRSAELLCPRDAKSLAALQRMSWHRPPRLSAAAIAAALAAAQRNHRHVGSFDASRHRAALRRFAGPLLVVAGESDGLVPWRDAQRTAEVRPEGRFERLSSCGHYPHRECPVELTRVLTGFARHCFQSLPVDTPHQATEAPHASSDYLARRASVHHG